MGSEMCIRDRAGASWLVSWLDPEVWELTFLVKVILFWTLVIGNLKIKAICMYNHLCDYLKSLPVLYSISSVSNVNSIPFLTPFLKFPLGGIWVPYIGKSFSNLAYGEMKQQAPLSVTIFWAGKNVFVKFTSDFQLAFNIMFWQA